LTGGIKKVLIDKNFKGTLIILVRHGECEGNVKGVFRGRTDFPLNKRGLVQLNQTKHLKEYVTEWV